VIHKNSETRNLKGGGTLTVEDVEPSPVPVEFEENNYWMKMLREEKEMRQKQEGSS